jgi:hypothetical protein
MVPFLLLFSSKGIGLAVACLLSVKVVCSRPADRQNISDKLLDLTIHSRILTHGVLIVQSETRGPYNKHYNVSHHVSSIFTGRDDINEELRKQCLPSEPPYAQKIQKRHVLYGLGGSGKTQICLRFAQEHRERYVHSISHIPRL